MTISAISGSCKYHDAVVKERTEQFSPALTLALEPWEITPPLQKLVASYALDVELCTQLAKGTTRLALLALSSTLEPCGILPPLQKLIASYGLDTPDIANIPAASEDLYCMTITQIEEGGDKAAAVAMRYLNRCKVMRKRDCAPGDRWVFRMINPRDRRPWQAAGKPDLEIIQTVCLDAWRYPLYYRIRDRSLEASTPQGFKDRICFHSIALRTGKELLPDIDPQNKEALMDQLRQEQTDVAREIVEVSKPPVAPS